MDFLEIAVNNQKYLVDSGDIKELIAYKKPDILPGSSKYIEGIISHKNNIIPVISIRNLLGFVSYESTQLQLLKDAEGQHETWVKDFEHSLITGKKFNKALDPNKCQLGQWINSTIECMKCNNHGFVDLLKKNLFEQHNALHIDGNCYLNNNSELSTDDKISTIKNHALKTINGLHILSDNIEKLTYSFEQMLVMNIKGIEVAIVIDNIEKNRTLEEKRFHTSKENLSKSSEYIQFIDHYKLDTKIMFSIKFTDKFLLLIERFSLKNDNLS